MRAFQTLFDSLSYGMRFLLAPRVNVGLEQLLDVQRFAEGTSRMETRQTNR